MRREMSQSTKSKRNLIVGVSALALIAAGVVYAGMNYPPNGQQTSGTIAPAERYRNAQVNDNDVQLGDQHNVNSMQIQGQTTDTSASNEASADAASQVHALGHVNGSVLNTTNATVASAGGHVN